MLPGIGVGATRGTQGGRLVGAGWGAKVGLREVFIDNEEFRLEAMADRWEDVLSSATRS